MGDFFSHLHQIFLARTCRHFDWLLDFLEKCTNSLLPPFAENSVETECYEANDLLENVGVVNGQIPFMIEKLW